ncbi:putative ABC transporter permease protein [Gordonia hirsuta DSM 44140 = NBRC 16056]|uniref:Putative ABC transporter permease protein n=1 Tax=Gordonia hirsuta DSM 44140 = NBRC 16056 TaxID=1121927 RepID=L7LFD1_9ACTN|nr:iron ABC transporter permease [Gordonia hirsuta]GAC58768.1 putative ABC transporter permease protein [Gordonia hirsuta DSM 44140 = NBRC 16056]
MTRRAQWALGVLLVLLALLGVCSLFLGSTWIPFGNVLAALTGDHEVAGAAIVRDLRVPRTITAITVGAALGLAGMQMQTLFRNPLADPYILGASSGASLGVALVVLLGGTAAGGFTKGLTGMGRSGMVIAAAIGAGVVLGIIAVLSRWVRASVALLLVGVMLASLSTAVVAVLLTVTRPQLAQQFLVWGMGTFQTPGPDLWIMVPLVAAGGLLAALTIRPLNALLLGEGYARSMGIGIGSTRLAIIVSAAVLAGVTTAFCGPIGFLGLVVPHLARFAVGSSDHRLVMPATLLIGAGLALVCGVIAEMPGSNAILPLGAVTAMFGAPVVILVLVRASRGRLSGVGL